MEWLKLKYDLLVIALRIWLLKLLGVDVLLERAFKEGWQMAHDVDETRCIILHGIKVTDVEEMIHMSRCWRSVDEAWVNSDAQELFE